MSFALDTPIMAAYPLRWTTVGKVETGDVLLDAHGAPCRAVADEPILPETMYRVQFSTGEEFRVGGEHLWTTLTRAQREGLVPGGDWAAHGSVVTTDALYATREALHAVGACEALDGAGWHLVTNIEPIAPEVARSVATKGILLGETWVVG